MGLPPVCVCTYLQKFIFLNGVVLVEVHLFDEFPQLRLVNYFSHLC